MILFDQLRRLRRFQRSQHDPHIDESARDADVTAAANVWSPARLLPHLPARLPRRPSHHPPLLPDDLGRHICPRCRRPRDPLLPHIASPFVVGGKFKFGLGCCCGDESSSESSRSSLSSASKSSSSASSNSSSSQSSFSSEDSCGFCTDSLAPHTFQVVIAGVTNSTCTSCASLNATYILTFNAGVSCQWRLIFSPAVCVTPVCGAFPGFNRISLTFIGGAPGTINYSVVLNSTGGADQLVWQSASPITYPVDCHAIAGISLPFLARVGTCCSGVGSTATITAL